MFKLAPVWYKKVIVQKLEKKTVLFFKIFFFVYLISTFITKIVN